MTTSAPASPPMSTPRRLRFLIVAILILAGLDLLIASGVLARARAAMKTIGHDAAPSIIAAQEISSALADLDANAANYLLGNAVHRKTALEAFEKRRRTITEKLVGAAQNITYDEEKQPILILVDGIGRYVELVAEMRYRRDTGDDKGAAVVYRNATDFLHQDLLASADRLDDANRKHLDGDYRAQEREDQSAEIIVGFFTCALLAVLLWAQLYLFRKMRRIFNLPLVGATLAGAIFLFYVTSAIASAKDDLRVAKEDAFESIHVLWKARAIAYDANGDESRYLFDKERQAQYEYAFRDKVKRLAATPREGAALADLATSPPAFSGLFADELKNITFPGEEDAAKTMVRAFAAYWDIDLRMRRLEKSGKHDDAIELCIGVRPDESNAAFDRFDAGLLDVVKINHDAFDRTIAKGESALQRAAWLVPGLAIAIALLGVLGLRARLREYEA